MRSAAVLPLVLAAIAAAPVPVDDLLKRDMKAIQGDWVCDYITNSKGVEKTPEAGVSVRGERLSFTVRGAVLETWAFTLDPTKEPKRIDLRKESRLKDGDDLRSGDWALRGVYRVEGTRSPSRSS
jgi:uncharacterized protein (TIGR03067 family)